MKALGSISPRHAAITVCGQLPFTIMRRQQATPNVCTYLLTQYYIPEDTNLLFG